MNKKEFGNSITRDELDEMFINADEKTMLRTNNLKGIPTYTNRLGGKRSYAEWCHTIGVFQTLMYMHGPISNCWNVVDFGCGYGLGHFVSKPFVHPDGLYFGLDVDGTAINFCEKKYSSRNNKFHHIKSHNAHYANGQSGRQKWPIIGNMIDVVLGISVFTHLNKEDAKFNISEICRVLRPGGMALLTFFTIDDTDNHKHLPKKSYYHNSERLMFKQIGESGWYTATEVPEKAIAINCMCLEEEVVKSGLKIPHLWQGSWINDIGIFYQDVAILKKDE